MIETRRLKNAVIFIQTFHIGVNFWFFLGNSQSSFPTQDDSGLGALEYDSLKKKRSNINTDHCSTYNNFKDEKCYAIGKSAAIRWTTALFGKFKKSHPRYGHTESSVRTMRGKYHRLVKSSRGQLLRCKEVDH